MLTEKAATFTGLPLPYKTKVGICVAADIFDMTAGRLLLGAGTVGDVITGFIMFMLWGPLGLAAIWEVADVTEQLDGFVPTNTLIAIVAHRRGSLQH